MLRFIRSVGFAVKGIRILVKTQPNFRVHLCAVVGTCFLAGYLEFSRTDWILLLLIQLIVLITEAVNTAIEFLVDKVSPEYNELAGRIKDISAGGVLIASFGSVVIGVLLFWEYFCKVL